MATQTVIVEGVLESNGQDSSSSSIAGQTLSNNVVSSTPRYEWDSNSQL
jgi:hypothetical protein